MPRNIKKAIMTTTRVSISIFDYAEHLIWHSTNYLKLFSYSSVIFYILYGMVTFLSLFFYNLI